MAVYKSVCAFSGIEPVLEQLEKKQDKHNGFVERVYRLEESVSALETKEAVSEHRIKNLENSHCITGGRFMRPLFWYISPKKANAIIEINQKYFSFRKYIVKIVNSRYNADIQQCERGLWLCGFRVKGHSSCKVQRHAKGGVQVACFFWLNRRKGELG